MNSLKVISFGIYEDNQNPINHIYKDKEVLYMDGCFWDTNTWVFGYLNGYKGKTENELISYYELICKKRLHLKYRIISAPEYMKNIIPIMEKHNDLYKKASKYKRKRHGKPDVELFFDHYNKYKYEIENANKLVKNRKSLLFVATRIVCRYQTIKEMTIDEFSFNEYIHGYNDIYRINNSNYNKG